MIKTPVHKVKDIEFSDIISISKSDIVDFWIFSWVCFSRERVIFTVEIKICIEKWPFQILVLETYNTPQKLGA